MIEPARFNLERLWGDGEFLLFRAKREARPAQVLVEAPALEQPLPEPIARLQHAYSLAGQLDPAWAARPLELVHHEGRPRLFAPSAYFYGLASPGRGPCRIRPGAGAGSRRADRAGRLVASDRPAGGIGQRDRGNSRGAGLWLR
jgi:hypothetical protein